MSTCLLLICSLVRPVILTDARNVRAFKAQLKLDTQRREEKKKKVSYSMGGLSLKNYNIWTLQGPPKMNQMNYKYELYHAYRLSPTSLLFFRVVSLEPKAPC